MTSERATIATAACSLGDKIAARDYRLDDIERALSRPLPPDERKALRREYLDLTDKRDAA